MYDPDRPNGSGMSRPNKGDRREILEEDEKLALIRRLGMKAQEEQNKAFNKQELVKRAEYRTSRNEDLSAGRARGEKLFGKEALGRVDEKRSGTVADILARRQAQLEGFTPEEQQAMREQNMKSIVQNQQAGARDLRRQQASSGVRGGLASAQQQSLQSQNQQQLADQERQLFLSQIAEKRGALDKFEGSTRTTEQDELARKGINMGQKEKELAGKLSTEFGYGSLGAAERASAMQSVLGDKALLGGKEIAKMTEGKK